MTINSNFRSAGSQILSSGRRISEKTPVQPEHQGVEKEIQAEVRQEGNHSQEVQTRSSHEIEPASIKFEPEVQRLINTWGLQDAKELKQFNRLRALDKNRDGEITTQELDINRDGNLIKKELEYIIAQPDSVFDRPLGVKLNSPPEPLPNAIETGPALLEVNNPEVNKRFGLQSKTELPVNESKRLRFFSYGNRNSGDIPKRIDMYQTALITNNTGKDIRVRVKGSAFDNTGRNSAQVDFNGKAGSELMSNATRQSDYALNKAMISDQHQIQPDLSSNDGWLNVPAGQSLALISHTNEGGSDFRAFYEVEFDNIPVGTTLPVEVGLTKSVLGSRPQNASAVRVLNKGQVDQLHQAMPNYPNFADDVDQPHTEIRNAVDYQNPGTMKRLADGQISSSLEKMLDSPNFSETERQDWRRQLSILSSELGSSKSMSIPLRQKVEQWNAQVKMTQQVLRSKNDSTQHTPWNMLFPLGRFNGVKPNSEIKSDFEIKLGEQAYERNFALVTNPLNQAGSDNTDALPFENPSPNTKPEDTNAILKPATQAYGQYAGRYEITANISNPGPDERQLNIRFGTPDEMGDVKEDGWVSLFDQLDGFMSEIPNEKGKGIDERARFTGVICVKIGSQEPQFIPIAHGQVQNPELLQSLSIPPGTDAPIPVNVSFYVPTNNTGPHILQFSSPASQSVNE